jgi:hypothetical protein
MMKIVVIAEPAGRLARIEDAGGDASAVPSATTTTGTFSVMKRTMTTAMIAK